MIKTDQVSSAINVRKDKRTSCLGKSEWHCWTQRQKEKEIEIAQRKRPQLKEGQLIQEK